MNYTKEDCRCWIDGTEDTDRCMKMLASMMPGPWLEAGIVVRDVRWATSGSLEETYVVLRSGDPDVLSDDASEWDDATDHLRRHTDSGLVWVWKYRSRSEIGDLWLETEEERNNGNDL
jgi:hypothetical protein